MVRQDFSIKLDKEQRRFGLQQCVPKYPKQKVFDDCINELSPIFVKIYNQALEAEAMNLDEVAGVAFRKAFEFLIKDYCISKHKDKENEIKVKFLGKCIKDYISDARIMQCSEKATWLGNDETHYVRKWENKDINDLKTLIHLTINWIVNEKLTENYMASFDQE